VINAAKVSENTLRREMVNPSQKESPNKTATIRITDASFGRRKSPRLDSSILSSPYNFSPLDSPRESIGSEMDFLALSPSKINLKQTTGQTDSSFNDVNRETEELAEQAALKIQQEKFDYWLAYSNYILIVY